VCVCVCGSERGELCACVGVRGDVRCVRVLERGGKRDNPLTPTHAHTSHPLVVNVETREIIYKYGTKTSSCYKFRQS